MIQRLAIQHNKAIAYILFFSFYISCVSPLYAATKMNYPPIGNANRFPVYNKNTSPSAGSINRPVLNTGNAITVPSVNSIAGNNTLSLEIPAINAEEPVDFIGGPSQPEMSAFKSAGTNDMVNLFTGDFSYNIPLLDVGGYPVNIFYNGGITMEQEASWVGLGWNINPGTVSRNMRGVPDDFDGTEKIKQTQTIKPNVTWGGRLGVDVELVGIKDVLGFSIGASMGASVNNYLGPAVEFGLKGGLNFKVATLAGSEKIQGSGGQLKTSASVEANLSSRNGLTINPNISLGSRMTLNSNSFGVGIGASTSYNSRTGIKSLNLYEQASMSYQSVKNDPEKARPGGIGGSMYGTTLSFNKPSYVPTIRMPITNSSHAGQFQIGAAMFGGYGSAEIEVYKQESKIDASDTVQRKPMVGFMYAHKATNNVDAIMDFTRFNDKEVTPKTPVISVPQYAYDIFSISGEGTGGTIRAYRNDLGYVRDNKVRSKDNSFSLGVDVGIPGHVGANLNMIQTPSSSGDWEGGNKLRNALAFKENTALNEYVYFRNPGETSVINEGAYDKIGGTDLVRFKLGGDGANPTIEPVLERFDAESKKTGEVFVSNALNGEARKKRSQVINMLTAGEATEVGLDTLIKDYAPAVIVSDTLQYAQLKRVDELQGKRPHHISEINVTETDGKRYVYGLPVYNLVQKDYTVTVSGVPDANDLVTLQPDEVNIKAGFPGNKDGYKLITETPPYAHSFLLTGLLSPDYVDVTGNGITEDDMGTAVKFNYSKMAQAYKWRTPYNTSGVTQAHFNSGNLTEAKDDKGIFSYGERESWYLHSIEGKNMIAVFTLEQRQDAKGVISGTATINANDESNKRLEKIDLYNKGDIRKNGYTNARPIKTVWFEYDYSLCANVPGNSGVAEPLSGPNKNQAKGKLTLKGIYFTYNGVERGSKNRYVFEYGNTPSYEPNASDRWGNYKPKSQNPQTLKNSLHPYTQQNPLTVHDNAAAWNLHKILLPSGGQLEVTYESDDYGYVQNRQAAVMMPISNTARGAANTGNRLFDIGGNGKAIDNDIIYITVPENCVTKQEVYDKYLSGIEQLAFRLAVNMPKGKEYITVYANYDDYGVGSTANSIWIKLKPVDGYSPLSLTAVEHLREHLPGQAFKGYDTQDMSLKEFGNMMSDIHNDLGEAFKNPVTFLREEKKAQTIVLAESFIRLNQPAGKKYGGGHRVKQIVLKDNWDRMTEQYLSAYGQQYDYTTTEVFNGKTRKISSGVASYEPSIGGEENPFQEILQVANRLPLGPASYESIEMPILDAFYPAPLVGYSKVTVRSVHSGKKDAGGRKSRSGIGRQVTEFYTAKDFPVRFNYSGIDPASDKQQHVASLFKFFSKTSFDARAISQGFLVELNDMHGKMKSQSSYGEADTTTQLNYTRYYYRNTGQNQLNEKFDFAHNALGGEVKKGNMGIDIELMTDAREFSVASASQQVQAQVDWMIPGPFPVWLPFVWPVFGKSENYYRAVTTTKVVSYHSIVDSMVVIDKGSSVTTKNQVFDAETGSVIVSSTNNEFDQPVYQTSYPAYWAYGGMGLAYKNIGVSFKEVNFLDGKPVSVIPAGDLKYYFESGDEIYVSGGEKPTACEAIYISGDNIRRLWVVDKKRNTSPLMDINPDFIFIDKEGNPFTRNNVTIKVIRSGRRNLLGAQVASFASMINPVTGTTLKKLSMSGSSQVLQASAIEYKEKWQTDRDIINRYRTEKESNGEGSNLIVNGDFSAGSTGFFSDYVVGSNTGTYQILTSVNGCKDKPMTGNMMVADGHMSADKVVWGQNVTVEPGKDYMFTCWAQTVTSGTVARLIVKINGVLVSPTVVLFPTSCYWDHISFTWNAGTATTAVITIINTETEKPQNDFAIDNINFRLAPVEEPKDVEVQDCDGHLELKINPYVKGLLGTFVNHRALTFYGDRATASTATPTNIAKDGVLANFASYWQFNGNNHLAPVPNTSWVWNSEITRINGQGAELETKNALNIYTAAQYGFNKTLPLAITQNSRYGEMFSEGFEDYNYKNNINKSGGNNGYDCYQKNVDFSKFDGGEIVSEEVAGVKAHSGKYMFKLSGNSGATTTIPIGNSGDNNFNLQYQALSKSYATSSYNAIITNPPSLPYSGNRYEYCYTGVIGANFYHANKIDRFSIDEKGTANRTFAVTQFDNGYDNNHHCEIWEVDKDDPNEGATMIKQAFFKPSYKGMHEFFINIRKHSGKAQFIIRKADRHQGSHDFELFYSLPFEPNYEYLTSVFHDAGSPRLGCNTSFFDTIQNIPVKAYLDDNLYYEVILIYIPNKWIDWDCGSTAYTPPMARTPRAWVTNFNQTGFYHERIPQANTVCNYTAPIKADETMLNPSFKLEPGKKMLLSAWVREECTPPNCTATAYTSARISMLFTNNNNVNLGLLPFLPSGPIIDGWQKIEMEFTPPEGATNVMLWFQKPGAGAAYFDDVRIHPFSANMKSYVYDPVSLLLKAELNENNYASYYEYDEEGTLIRTKVETTEGVKTIRETRSAKQKDISTFNPIIY